MDQNIKITNVYAEMTPNPATIKFVADRPIVPSEGYAEYLTKNETKDSSPLAESLFGFPFVKAVFISNNFVTITKNDSIAWDFVTMELREFVMDYLRKNLLAVTKFPERIFTEEEIANNIPVNFVHATPKNEIEEKIISILDEYVKPAVENDGGAIHFQSFEEGTVSVIMRGSCSGCPSSTMTLKSGIETMMKQMVPEVKEVVAYEG